MKKLLSCCFIFFAFLSVSYAQLKPLSGRTIFKVYISETIDGVKLKETIPKHTEVKIIDISENTYSIVYSDKILPVSMNEISCNRLELRDFKKMIKDLKDIGTYRKEVESFLTGNKIEFIPDKKTVEISDPLKYEIDHIRYCAGKYNKQIMSGYSLTIIGSAISSGALFLDEPEVPMIIGGCMVLIGSIVIVDSHKWMKKLYFGPNGVGVKFKF